MPRPLIFLLCVTTATGCECRYDPPDSTPDSKPGETGPETGPDSTDTQPPGDWFGIAEYGVIMVPDGTRIEETFGDETTWGEGYSDAYEGPTADIIPGIREELYPQGSIAKPAYVTGITITLPGHVDMALGKRTPHGHHPANATDGPGLYRPELPTLWEHLRDQDESVEADQVGFTGNTLHMMAIGHSAYPGLGYDTPGSYVFVDSSGGNDPGEQPGEDPPVIEQVIEHLQAGWRLQLVNLHQIDRMGHYNPPNHVPSIMEVDDPLVSMWNDSIQGDDELADRTVMAIVSDHGRHRFDSNNPPWANHGDGCSGCREVPLMMLGPGVRQGVVTEGPYVLEDVGATMAWLMGIHAPFSTGMIMTEMLEGEPTIPQRSGPQAIHSSGDLVAYQQFRDDLASRSEIVLDGEVFANTEAIHVEQPKVLAVGETDFACWREVTVGTDEDYWNWLPVCKLRSDGGAWEDLGTPLADLVWPYWDPAMAADGSGRLHLAWSGNLNGNAQAGTGVYLARWTSAMGWEGGEDYEGGAYFPVWPSLVIDDDGASWVAWSAGSSDGQGRYTRHVDVYRVSWPAGGDQSWDLSFTSPDDDAEGRDYERIEAPALSIVDGDIHLAYVAMNEDGSNLVYASLAGGAGSWSSVHAADDSGDVYLHVRPRWSDDGQLYWGRLGSDGNAEVCRVGTDDMTDPSCVTTGVRWIESLAPVDGGVQVTTSSGDRQWTISQIDF